MFTHGAPLPVGPWSPVAQAEWSCIVHELTLGVLEHHERCPDCAIRFPCPALERGFAIAEDWLVARCLKLKADVLRAELEPAIRSSKLRPGLPPAVAV